MFIIIWSQNDEQHHMFQDPLLLLFTVLHSLGVIDGTIMAADAQEGALVAVQVNHEAEEGGHVNRQDV